MKVKVSIQVNGINYVSKAKEIDEIEYKILVSCLHTVGTQQQDGIFEGLIQTKKLHNKTINGCRIETEDGKVHYFNTDILTSSVISLIKT